MILQLNPLLEGLDAARAAAREAIHADDEVSVDDQGDHWVFEFVPVRDQLGGGVVVRVAKQGSRVIEVIREQ